MVDVLVNGKTFARGEVVVIVDNYGVRITEMMPGQVKL
jgi:flagellar motor switch/type III secretory pathway protein FliN